MATFAPLTCFISVMATQGKSAYNVTVAGGAIDAVLVMFKFAAGIIGNSAAMIADAVHSLSDLITDVVVLVFVKLSNKPRDETHDYGHGKYETLASAIIAIAMLAVGIMILYDGSVKILSAINGETLPTPGYIALWAALVGIAMKEWAYQFTARVGRRSHSQVMIANAWHHRTDALSSLGTAIGIGGAILLGHKWTVLDPIAAVVVSFFIIALALKILRKAIGDLLEQSLPKGLESEITRIVMDEPAVSDTHNLMTRRIGNHIAIEMHVRMLGCISLYEAHQHATSIERRLIERFGDGTHIGLHLEPIKVDGKYIDPSKDTKANE